MRRKFNFWVLGAFTACHHVQPFPADASARWLNRFGLYIIFASLTTLRVSGTSEKTHSLWYYKGPPSGLRSWPWILKEWDTTHLATLYRSIQQNTSYKEFPCYIRSAAKPSSRCPAAAKYNAITALWFVDTEINLSKKAWDWDRQKHNGWMLKGTSKSISS